MPLTPEQQLYKDSQFFHALMNSKYEAAEQYLREGANPIAVIPNNGTIYDTVAEIFIAAVPAQVEFLIKHAGDKIKFDRHPKTRKGEIREINLLQLAATACPVSAFAPIAECADRNSVTSGKNTKDLLNELVTITTDSGTKECMSFACYLIRRLDRELLLTNYLLVPLNIQHRNVNKRFIDTWPYRVAQDYNPDEGFTPEQPRFIEWAGPSSTLEMLVPYGIDLTTQVGGLSPLATAQMFVNHSDEIADWIECSLQFWNLGDTTSIVPGSYKLIELEGKEYLHMDMTTCNKYYQHPVTFFVRLDWQSLVTKLEQLIVQQRNTQALTHMYGDTLRRHSQERRQLESLITEVPEVIIAKGTPNDSLQVGAYNFLCNRLMGKFTAEGLKKAGVFKANFTGNASRISKAGYILKALASSAPVGGELITNAIELGSTSAANRVQDAQDQANYDKLVGVNIAKLVVAIALRLCEELRDYNPKTVNAAVDKILKQIDQIRNYQGESQEDLIRFLIQPVLANKSLVKDHSSSGSDYLSVVPYTGAEDMPQQASSTRCCVMM